MNLDDAQRRQVTAWLAEGLKLSEIQQRLAAELGLRLTYLELRLLLDDLQLTPKDQPPSAEAAKLPEPPSAKGNELDDFKEELLDEYPEPEALPVGGGKVAVTVDQLARPGAIASGKATFSDGQTAEWHLDQFGRLGLAPTQPGYRPSPGDMQQFQMALQSELQRMGF